MDNERIEALNLITSDGDNYIKLSEANESKRIGKVIIDDLILYIENELNILNILNKEDKDKIIQYQSDKNKLEKILKTISYSSFDDIVLLKKFSKFKKKYTKLKKDLIDADEDLKIEILKDLYEKIRIVYGVKKDKPYLTEIYKRVQDKNKKILIQTGGVGEDEIIREGEKLITDLTSYREIKPIHIVNFRNIFTQYIKLINLLKINDSNKPILIKLNLLIPYIGIDIKHDVIRYNNYIFKPFILLIKEIIIKQKAQQAAEAQQTATSALKKEEDAEAQQAATSAQQAATSSLKKEEDAEAQQTDKAKNDDGCCFPIIELNSENKSSNREKADKAKNDDGCCFPIIELNSENKSSNGEKIVNNADTDDFNCCFPIIELNTLSPQQETTLSPQQETTSSEEEKTPSQQGTTTSPQQEQTPSEKESHDKTLILNNIKDKLKEIQKEIVGGMSEYSNKQIPSSKKNINEEPTISDHYKNMKDLYIKLVSTYYKLIDGTDADESKTLDFLYKDEDDEDVGAQHEKKETPSSLQSEEQKSDEANSESSQKGEVDGEGKINKEQILNLREQESKANSNIKKNDTRLKILEEILKKMLEYLIELYKICYDIKNIPQATEYEDYIKEVLKKQKINFFEDQKNKEKHLQHPIIKAINQEINNLKTSNDNLKEDIKKVGKQIADTQLEQKYLLEKDRRPRGGYYNKMKGGVEKEEKNKLKIKYLSFGDLLGEDKEDTNSLKKFVTELKANTENIGNNGNANKKSRNEIDNTIYEDIWNEYNIGINKSEQKDLLKNIKQGEILYDTVKINNLVPEIALEINFQDKSIFIFLILLIRTIIMVIIEFIIEYNIVKTLPYMIIVYGILYIVLIVFSLVLVNYDSYKLRIVFNYLNLHINSNNIILHLILFILFVSLIMIMIQSEDLIKNFGDLFDYTNIYMNIYELSILIKDENFENTLSRNEKIKLLYRLEIITMIVFIFSSFIILIL